MAFYRYKGKTKQGEAINGKVEARNETQAAAALRERDILVISLKPFEESTFSSLNQMFSGVSQDDLVNFTRQLSTMISAGLGLTQALSILEQQSEKAALTKMIGELTREIQGGNSFAKALGQHADIFPTVYIQLVRAGEAAGVLDDVLERLAHNMEKNKEFRGKTKGALIYPAIVLTAMVIVASIMMIFVIPKLSDMYADFGAELPLATKLLIDFSTFFANFWWLILAGVVGGVYALKRWRDTSTGRYMTDRWMLKIPVFGELRKKVILTEFTRTAALLLGAGISLLQALEILADAMDNVLYRRALLDAANKVEKGVSLSQAIEQQVVFPLILSQMAAVGEETGRLDEVLGKLSSYFESESEQAVKNLTTALEPLIMVVLGLGVGAMVVAIIMPIYNLTSQF